MNMARKDHTAEGLLVYAKGMEKSVSEKEKLLPYVKEGIILEIGCGAGTVIELLSRNFPKSTVIGIDNSKQMVLLASEKEYFNLNVAILQGEAINKQFKNGSIDTIIMSSVLHEVYSYSYYQMEVLEKAISNACEMLTPGGRLIIRDGVMPDPKPYYLKFVGEGMKDLFEKFVKDFTPRRIHYSFDLGSDFPKLNSADTYEFLSKYFYKENWEIEVKEQFGILNVSEYCGILEKNGMKIIEAFSYLIDFLKNKYEKEVVLLEKNGEQYITANYPDSTAIIVGEKI
jgi:SAM-dependent methyltransferase